MGLFDYLFKKKGIPEKMNFLGKDYEINPDAMVFSQQGLDKYQVKDYAGAVAAFTKAIYAQPTNQNFYTMRGTAYEDMGNDIEAEKDFRKALELLPNDFVAAYRLGMVYFRKQDFENAVKWLRVSYKNAPDADLSHVGITNNNIFFVHKKIIAGNLGNFLTQLKQFEEGFKYLDEAIKLDPKYHNPYMVKGMAYAQMGKPKEGIPYLKKAMELGNPQAGMAIKMLEQLSQQASHEEEESEELDLDFVFHSSDHLRYENGRHVSGPHGGAPRAIKVEANISGNEGYTVTMFNTDGGQAVVQMAPKQMKLVGADNEKIQLKGYGRDAMGASFADYGLTIYHNEGNIEKCILHMFDRNVDIEYLP
jgi:tetratricopeptide (TPR) repeat protein